MGAALAPLAPSTSLLRMCTFFPGDQEEEQPVSLEARRKRASLLPAEVPQLAPLEAGRSATLVAGGQEEEQLTSSETGKKRSLRLPGEEAQLASLDDGRSAALVPGTRKSCSLRL